MESEDETKIGGREALTLSLPFIFTLSFFFLSPMVLQVQIIFFLILLFLISYQLGTFLPTNPSRQATGFFGNLGETVGRWLRNENSIKENECLKMAPPLGAGELISPKLLRKDSLTSDLVCHLQINHQTTQSPISPWAG